MSAIQPVVSSGGTMGVLLSNVSTAILTANAGTKKIIFHNPGAVTMYVCQATDFNGGTLVAGANLPGNWQILPGGVLTLSGDGIAAGAWLAAAASVGSNPLTVAVSQTL